MLGGSGKAPRKNRTRRRRVQKRALPTRDFFDPEKNEVSHHSVRRMRRYRFRRFLWFLQVGFCLCLGLCIPYVAKWGYEKIFFQNDQLRLSKIKIETTGSISEAEIAKLSGVSKGVSLLRLDLNAIEARIERLPEIEKVEVVRQLPDQLSITVTERTPVAWLACPDYEIRPLRDGGVLLDFEGIAFPSRADMDSLAHLPSIEVNGIIRPEHGQKVSALAVAKALHLISVSKEHLNSAGLEIRDIRVLGSWGLLCRYGEDLLVTFDMNRIEGGLTDLARILKKSSESQLSLATVNLVTVKNIPVTFHSKTVPEKW